jgi:hypothetical protein
MRTTGTWQHPVPVPQFDATCADGHAIDLDDLRGRVLRIIALSSDGAASVVPQAGQSPVPPSVQTPVPSAVQSSAPPAVGSTLPPPPSGVTTILLARTHLLATDQSACVASEPETWTAFAILSGVPDDALAGEQVLVDPNHWLRARWRPGDPGDWTNPSALAAAVADILAHPLTSAVTIGHVHHN